MQKVVKEYEVFATGYATNRMSLRELEMIAFSPDRFITLCKRGGEVHSKKSRVVHPTIEGPFRRASLVPGGCYALTQAGNLFLQLWKLSHTAEMDIPAMPCASLELLDGPHTTGDVLPSETEGGLLVLVRSVDS